MERPRILWLRVNPDLDSHTSIFKTYPVLRSYKSARGGYGTGRTVLHVRRNDNSTQLKCRIWGKGRPHSRRNSVRLRPSFEAKPFHGMAVVEGRGTDEAAKCFPPDTAWRRANHRFISIRQLTVGFCPRMGLGNSRQLLSSSATVEDWTACWDGWLLCLGDGSSVRNRTLHH